MADRENEKIISYRNQTSMCLDDLVALVSNGALAGELRIFSDDVMKLKPGFAFDLKQARKLKDATELALKQYAAKTIRDDELIRFMSDARVILQEKNLMNGGRTMGILEKVKTGVDKALHGKENKKQQSLDSMEAMYRDTCEQILTMEKEMDRCVRDSRGLSPNSMAYRNNERAYMRAKNKIPVLQKTESMLRKVLDEADRRNTILEYNDVLKKAEEITKVVLGDEKTFSKAIAEAEVMSERLENKIKEGTLMGDTLLDMAEEDIYRTNEDFSAKVAAEERRQVAMQSAGFSTDEIEEREQKLRSEFDGLVRNDPEQ